MLLTIIIFILVLSLLVFVHELGHFWVARKFGVKAEEFGFGFPPRIWGIYKSKEGAWKTVKGKSKVEDAKSTIYSVNLIPLGGFVKLGEDDASSNDPKHFINRPIWQRFFILSAGVSMNVILAAVLISIGLMIGLPQVLDESLISKAQVKDRKIQVVQVIPDSPAEKAGLKMADFIISINEKSFISDQELQDYVSGLAGQELTYKVKRGQEEIILKTTPEIREETGRAGIGIAIVTTGLVKYPWFIAIWEGIKTTIFLIWFIIIAFYELFKGLILGHGLSADIAGPVGIAAFTGQVARMGFIYLLQFTALLSINLAIINFLPFPALDGGRALFLLIEKMKGSPVKREIEAVIHNLGFALLMVLVLVVTFRDVARFGYIFRGVWDKIF
ncbi:MAG: RIP metalloprotease RseP [Patescibacteria group bacterium]